MNDLPGVSDIRSSEGDDVADQVARLIQSERDCRLSSLKGTRDRLSVELDKLTKFLSSPMAATSASLAQQQLLQQQLHYMQGYLGVLNQRIELASREV